MSQEEINENIVASVARAMFHEERNAYPLDYNKLWASITEEERQVVRNKAIQWLMDLKKVSPKTYAFVESNYAEVDYR